MKNLLKNIENSEKNNPVLTAALQEIDRLNKLIEDAKSILEMTPSNTTSQLEGGEPYKPTITELNASMVDLLSNLFY